MQFQQKMWWQQFMLPLKVTLLRQIPHYFYYFLTLFSIYILLINSKHKSLKNIFETIWNTTAVLYLSIKHNSFMSSINLKDRRKNQSKKNADWTFQKMIFYLVAECMKSWRQLLRLFNFFIHFCWLKVTFLYIFTYFPILFPINYSTDNTNSQNSQNTYLK